MTGLRVGSGKNNYFGIGSKIEIKSGKTYQTKIVKNINTHFGLNSEDVDVMRIVWTNGYPQNVINPEINQDVVEKQELKAGEKATYVMTFYLDPEMVNDATVKNLEDVTMSYTFFSTDYYKQS